MRPPPDHPLRWITDRVDRDPDSAAIIDDSGALNYGQLWSSLGHWSRILGAAGMEPGLATAVVTKSRARLARAVWLAMYKGLPLVVMNPSHTAPGRMMRQCGVEQVIADADVRLPEGVRRLPARPLDRPGDGGIEPSPLPMGKAQLMVPTSGTEGPARAVMLSARNLAASALATNRVLGLTRRHRWLCCVPLIHIAGIMILMRCAAAGASLRLKEDFDAADAAAAITSEGITHTSVVPAMLHRLLDAGADPSPLAAVLVGGAGVSDHLVRRALAAKWPMKITYGLTETTAHVALGDLLWSDRSVVPLPGTRIDITARDHETGRAVGWIQVSGPTVMLGYANPSQVPGDGLAGKQTFRTKDLGRWDKDGRLVVLGRGDDVLISGGVNVHPAQVEDLLAGCPGIREVAVTGRPDPVWGALLVALYIGEAEEQSVADWSRENIPGPMRPREFRRVQRLPRTPLGKIRRRDLAGLI